MSKNTTPGHPLNIVVESSETGEHHPYGTSYQHQGVYDSIEDENTAPTTTPRGATNLNRRSRRHSRRRTLDTDYDARYVEDEDLSEPIDEDDVDGKKELLNGMFGIIPFAGHLSKRDLNERSETVKKLYESVADLKPEQVKKPERNRMIGFGNVLYSILFGWWIFLWYIFVGILCFLSIFCVSYGKRCFQMAFYYLYPFGKYIERISDHTHVINMNQQNTESASLVATLERQESGDVNTSNTSNYYNFAQPKKRTFWSVMGMIIWFVFLAPILVVVHFWCCILSWFTVFGIPSSKVHFQGLKLLYKTFLELHVSDEFPPNVESDIMVCTYQAFNLYYYKYSLFGANVLLINMLPFVPASIVLGWAFGDEFIEEYGYAVFPCCLLGVVPLSYYISKAISSISAQSNYVVGAFLNASFGSVIELILYFATLYKGMSTIVVQAVTGSFLGDTLLMPGLSMVLGGMKHQVQYFNRHSAAASSLLLLVSVVGAFVPTLFYQIYGNYELNCGQCFDTNIFFNSTANSTSPFGGPRNFTRGNSTMYSLACQSCVYVEKDYTQDPIYQRKAKPLALTTAAILPLAYLIGLIFSLKTHNKFYLRPPKIDDEDSENKKAIGGHGHGAEWPRWVCIIILLLSTIAFAFVAESMTKSLEPAFHALSIPIEFAGLTVFALVPNISEFVSAIKFALQNNVTLSLEIGNVAGIQTALIQIPALVIFSTIIFQNDITKVFSLTFPQLDLVAIFFAVIILNYVTIDGKSNYFHGFSLIIVYVIIVVAFFFAYF